MNNFFMEEIKGIDAQMPLDTVRRIQWLPAIQEKFIGTVGWDGIFKLYSVEITFQKMLKESYQIFMGDPILTLTWYNQQSVILGMGDGSIVMLDLSANKQYPIGKHQGPVTMLHFLPQQNFLISGSTDKRIVLWSLGNPKPLQTVHLSQRILFSQLKQKVLVAALSNQKILPCSIQQLAYMKNEQLKASNLGEYSVLTSLAVHSKAVAYGSADGRINHSAIGMTMQGKLNLTSIVNFKGARIQYNSSSLSSKKQALKYINCLQYHPVNKKYLLAGGGDCKAVLWDIDNKKKYHELNLSNPITAQRISNSGNRVAIASGNDWSAGMKSLGKHQNRISIFQLKTPQQIGGLSR